MALRFPLFKIFTNDANVINIGVMMLEMITPCYFIFVFIEILSSALRGVGDVVVPMFLTMFGVCVLRIAWVFIAVPIRPQVSTIMYSYPVTWIVTAIMFIIYYAHRQKRIFKE